MVNEYTPKTPASDFVRLAYAQMSAQLSGDPTLETALKEFDQWLAEHDKQVLAKADEAGAYDAGMYAMGDMIGVEDHMYERILNPYRER